MNQGKTTSLLRSDTIAAQATPRGIGALAIVRLSGPQALTIAAKLVRDPKKLLEQPPWTIQLLQIAVSDDSLLDAAVCAIYHQPHSYTGENLVEFFLHGSPYLVAKVLERCYQEGARPADPGEFTLRAYLNGRMDLAQAEAVADLISANGEVAHRAATSQREGGLSRIIRRLRDKLLETLSLIELNFDFSDQEVPIINDEILFSLIDKIIEDLINLKESFYRGRLCREGAVVAIAGAPNVGKSTLFNALLGEDRAIVDDLPGTTRDSVEASVIWEGLNLCLIDTAGQAQYPSRPDQRAVEKAQIAARSADLVLWMMDLSASDPQPPPQELSPRILVVGNKVDLVSKQPSTFAIDLYISALQGTGIPELESTVVSKLLPDIKTTFSETIITHERHYEAICQALESLSTAKKNLSDHLGHELIVMDIRQASDRLGEIIGELTPEEVINRIFADFCIGK